MGAHLALRRPPDHNLGGAAVTLDDAIQQACDTVGIAPPKARAFNRWLPADAIGKNGKGDGRVILDDDHVFACNWQTGSKVTVWLKEERTPEDRKRVAVRRQQRQTEDEHRARRAADQAARLIDAARLGSHPYLISKGFPQERALTVHEKQVRQIVGDYIVVGLRAIVVPARIGQQLTGVQLIWEDGTKKFLFGGIMGGASHRLASGADTWLCEGFATGLSLRAALRGLNRTDQVLVCFSASNIAKVAGVTHGRRFIAADHDAAPAANPDQFGGLGAGEFFARATQLPHLMPADVGDDVNDVHVRDGIFAVQRLIADLLRRPP